MLLNVSCQLQFSAQTATPAIFMLRPRSGSGQWVVEERYSFQPFVAATEYVDTYGNLCQRFLVPTGDSELRVTAQVQTNTHIDVNIDAGFVSIDQLPSYALQFLVPSRYCESDCLQSLAREITAGCPLGYQQVEAIRRWIHESIHYQYGTSDASTSAQDVVQNQQGVCRDFAHLGIALCRSLSIPARMVVGYLYQLDPMDQHAWFEAYVGDRWYTFDPTQSDPLGNRVVVAYGRDAADVAFVTTFGALELEQMKVQVSGESI